MNELELLLDELEDVDTVLVQKLRVAIDNAIDMSYDVGTTDGYNEGRYEGRGPVCTFCGE